ncbi:hypothetical protein [Paractinoplanes lichenicola]|uniref:Uncharacterized protein n=1 Tax=Paractinoplanes lichenicola TaxID=2802976 RepID=A0ABS1W150_9ACTN|nr:hypothetical protein [Actinoplanes lichenicola]MBL7260465.1 hypothetical protein [Actinoplanes lichenicola]
MPSLTMTPAFAALAKPLVVAVIHLPLLLVVVLLAPIWILAGLRPRSHGDLALAFLGCLQSWSAELTTTVRGRDHA